MEKCQNTFSGITLENQKKKVKKHFIVQNTQIIASEYWICKKCIHLLIYDRILYVMQILEVFGICFFFLFSFLQKHIRKTWTVCPGGVFWGQVTVQWHWHRIRWPSVTKQQRMSVDCHRRAREVIDTFLLTSCEASKGGRPEQCVESLYWCTVTTHTVNRKTG